MDEDRYQIFITASTERNEVDQPVYSTNSFSKSDRPQQNDRKQVNCTTNQTTREVELKCETNRDDAGKPEEIVESNEL